ncbi:MAG: molybdenum cofactor biosynthesis protein B [Myxococcota bacterium]|jgi:molybdenum cofactor biosynthesis protein B|nr:molybdenum cofactor biosynthesis protein B [Myxococcota bacterium]
MGHVTEDTPFEPLTIAVLTVSDTRDLATDTSGAVLIERLAAAGHVFGGRAIVKDNIYTLRAQASQWIADSETHAILITGGTGFTSRDSTPEAMLPLFDKVIEGYGELFRQASYDEIGTSTIQSRTVAGVANGTVVFCMPGSPRACKTAWDRIICEQLDSRHRPCNFVEMVKPGAHRCGSRS